MPEAVHDRSVELVGTRPAGQGDHRPRQPAHIRRRIGGLHAEFLDGLQRHQRIQAAEGAQGRQHSTGSLGGQAPRGHPGIGTHPIHGEVIGIGPLPIGRELAGFSARGGGDIGARR